MATKRVIPLLDRVLVQRAEAPTQSRGGIFLPEKGRIKMQEGTVIAVGSGSRNMQTGEFIPLAVNVGDRVLLPAGGLKVDLGDGKLYQLFRESNILGVLEKKK
ncbi:10 kDa heat shock protein, mitochondrial-like [Aedes albopictus]|uniref:10 kDa heat shock protein, mitochondrial n=1 Tax=Aedes albopictus TaxID=7160 RepID=A0ABM1YRA5_AEDAL|nr:10 kDa heat shock protein, mitochondrial-like [Aedes albopictus]